MCFGPKKVCWFKLCGSALNSLLRSERLSFFFFVTAAAGVGVPPLFVVVTDDTDDDNKPPTRENRDIGERLLSD